MITVSVQPAPEKAECPQCRNRENIRDGTLTPHSSKRAYDVLTDSFGLCHCPKCGHRAGWSEFHRSTTTTP
jgi:predicted nucleic-acid-binding Zn-ribbon protein